MIVKLASAQYPIGFFSNFAEYENKAEQWVAEAAGSDARILVFPEYFSMELASIFGEAVYASLSAQLEAMQTLIEPFLALYQRLASTYQCLIQAGTFPVRQTAGDYRNRAFVFWPDGASDYQDKLIMTRFENEQWLIHPGVELKVFDSDWGRFAINVCYDSEFPLLAHRQVELGAQLLLVPSCTDTTAGYHRVRIGSQARALENQIYVVQSCTVGEAPWSEAVDVNIGAAGIYTPVDRGFPDDGVLAKGELNRAGWVYADIDWAGIDIVRHQGQVFNYRDWPKQSAFVP